MSGVAVVTGANRGIGFHIAHQLAASKRYARVIIGCRDPVAGDKAANEIVRYDSLSSPDTCVRGSCDVNALRLLDLCLATCTARIALSVWMAWQ